MKALLGPSGVLGGQTAPSRACSPTTSSFTNASPSTLWPDDSEPSEKTNSASHTLWGHRGCWSTNLYRYRVSHSLNENHSLGPYSGPSSVWRPEDATENICSGPRWGWVSPREGQPAPEYTASQVVGAQKHQGLVLPAWGVEWPGRALERGGASGTGRRAGRHF